MSHEDQQELAALYADETKLSERVCLAFVKADAVPPTRDAVDRRGWTWAERQIVDDHFDFTPANAGEKEDA